MKLFAIALSLSSRIGGATFGMCPIIRHSSLEDWTPNQVASSSSRFYLYGNLEELKQTAALMAKSSPHIATMLSSKTNETNSLKAPSSVDYASSPAFTTEGESGIKPASKKPKLHKDAAKGYKVSVGDVHNLLVEVGLVDTLAGAEHVNPCLKKGILMGHIKVDKSTTKDTVIHKASCVNCSQGKNLACTFADAMNQSTYAGGDYEEGGEHAEVKCKECGMGNYLTEICTGNKNYDCGKSHNHCTECDDFGTCIGDYREAHCQHCGDHYFRGNMGFACPSCGGGKSKDLSAMPSPPLSVWDGSIANAKEVFLAQLETKNEFEAAMAKAMVLGPAEAGGAGPGLAAMMSHMANQMGEGDDNDGEGGEGECVLM